MKFLIVKTSSLGDIIQSYPVVAYLKRHFPTCEIDWVVEKQNAELVSAHPDIRNTIIVNTRSWRKNPFSKDTWKEIKEYRNKVRKQAYDYVIDLQGNVKSGLLASQAKSNCKIGFGWDSVPEKPNMLFTNHRFNPPKNQNIRNDYLHLVEAYFNKKMGNCLTATKLNISTEQKDRIDSFLSHNSMKGRKNILVCPGSAWKNKQLTDEALIAFLEQVNQYEKCTFFFAWGSDKEKLVANKLKAHFSDNSCVLEKMPLPMLQNFMGLMDLVIAMDSLPLHLAGTTSTPTYSVFGASSASKYQPEGKQHTSLQGACPYGRTFEKRCPILRTCESGACIRHLKGDDVFTHFRNKNKL